jgi:hypothetical protein
MGNPSNAIQFCYQTKAERRKKERSKRVRGGKINRRERATGTLRTGKEKEERVLLVV